MERMMKGAAVLVAAAILFWALNTPVHWFAVIVLLAIILYVLFANPLGKHHLAKIKKSTTKKKKSTRKK